MGDPEARIERLRLLARLNQRISSSLDYDEALTAIARAASEIMAVPSVSVWVAEAAVAIRNARLFAGSETRRRTAEALADLLRLLSQTLEVETVAQRIAEDVRDLLHVGAASVYHLEPETDDLVVIASSVSPDSAFDWVLVLPRGYGTCGLAVQQKAPIASSDVLA